MPDEQPFDGFGIPLPAGLVEALNRHHDHAQMTAEALAARVDTFLSGLDVDGLMALRTMLNTGDMTKSITANFFDGQLVAILRYVKGVDPESGKDPLAG